MEVFDGIGSWKRLSHMIRNFVDTLLNLLCAGFYFMFIVAKSG
jgi:hypothetical protein